MKSKNILTLLTIAFFCYISNAQKATYKESNDPQATKLLNAMKKDYDSQKSIEIAFNLEIELPEKKKEVQKGKFIQEGKKYVATLQDQDIYCDGKDLWLYLKSQNEVQINSVDESDVSAFITPKDLIKMYETGEYLYAITGESQENGIATTQIEFKPLKKKSDYSKIRLSINKKNNRPVNMKVFSKDGSRFTLLITSYTTNKTYGKDTFVFNSKKYKGVRVEDLRID